MHPLIAAGLLLVQVQTKTDSASKIPADTSAKAVNADSARTARRLEARRIPLTAEMLNTAFDDRKARALLDTARAARLRQDSTLTSYDATTYTRISVGLRVAKIGRDRLAFRSENASRVRWSRKSGLWIEVKGARSVVPIVKIDDEEMDAPDFGELAAIPYYPGREPLFFMGNALARAEIDEEGFIHPLVKGAEAYYRYSTGDSIAIRLGGGRTIRVQELRVRARKPDWKLSVGSLWIDMETGQFVRGVFRLSQEMDIWEVAKEDDPQAGDDVPKVVKPLLNPMRASLKSVTIEYGLHEGRFWLPRVQTAEGEIQVGFVRAPAKFINTFTYASVNGTAEDTLPSITVTSRRWRGSADSIRADSTRRAADPHLRVEDSVYFAIRDSLTRKWGSDSGTAKTVHIGLGVNVTSDSNETSQRARQLARLAMRSINARRIRQCDTSEMEMSTERRYRGTVLVAVRVPCDQSVLAVSPDLPASIYDEGEELFDEGSKMELLAAIGMGTQPGFSPQRPVLKWGLGEGLMRYNRVEGLAPAVMVRQDLGAGFTASAVARIGLADWEPSGEVALTRSDARKTLGAALYRRLSYSNLFGDPTTFGASLSALLFARDEGLFYRTLGAELRGSGDAGDFLEWRAYVEQHRDASVHTHLSLARALGGPRFMGNIRAQSGTWGGMETRLHGSRGEDPAGLRMLGDVRLDAAVGASGFFRSYSDVTLSRSLPARLETALTASAGVAVGEPPVQKLFFLGGSQTVRGQLPATAAGTGYWLGRAEVGRTFVFVRPSLFFDIGWAGDRASWKQPGTPLSGAGIGASFLDGLFRVDLARGLQPTKQWRADLYLEARF